MKTTLILMTGVRFEEDLDRYVISVFNYGVRVWDNEYDEGTIYPWHTIRCVLEQEWDDDE